MATTLESTIGLGPQKSMFVLVIIVGCFAVLWPRILSPMFTGPPKDILDPNNYDKSAGCCDVVYETDINAIKIMTELCGNILRSQDGGIDAKTEQAFQTGKLSKNIVDMCRQEVNKTCGVDIAMFLNHNIALGKTYKQILDDIRSYNSSTCLKMNYGVSPWALGVPHLVGKWMQDFETQSVRQERPSHVKHPPIHPALRERGRAIPPSPQRVPHPTVPIVPHTGRPIPMRPPMGSPGRVAAPPKSSVGFLMPLYTLCIVIFFFYTMFKLVFRKTTQEPVTQPLKYVPDKQGTQFRKTVFNKPDRTAPEPSKLGSEELAQLRARLEETERALARVLGHMKTAPAQETPVQPYTNGSVPHKQRESSPILLTTKTINKDFTPLHKETTPPSWEASTPVHREETVLVEEFTPKDREPSPVRETIPVKEIPPVENAAHIKESLPSPPAKETEEEVVESKAEEVIDKEEEVKVSEVEKIGTKHEEDIVVKLRSSVEKENATVKVLGMEMRAHCEGGKKWTAPRSPTPPVPSVTSSMPAAVSHHPGRTTPDVEVSSIYLEGALPHQSRLLVADSETHTEKLTNGDDRDTPIVLSGKMTLSLINDTSVKSSPDRDYVVNDESIEDEDEDFVTASTATEPIQKDEEEYEKELKEEEEELEEDEEIIVNNNNNISNKKIADDKGEAIVTDETKAVIVHDVVNDEDLEDEEEEIEYEDDDEVEEVVEVVEEPKKDVAKPQVVEVEVEDEDEEEVEYEEEEVEEEEEEIEHEPVEDKTESTSVDARIDNNNTISTSSDANTSKKVDEEIEYEEDDEDEEIIDDEIYVEEAKTPATTGDNVNINSSVEKKVENKAGTVSSDNSLSKDTDQEEEEEEEEVEYEEEEIEVEDDEEEEIEEEDEVIESGNKKPIKDT